MIENKKIILKLIILYEYFSNTFYLLQVKPLAHSGLSLSINLTSGQGRERKRVCVFVYVCVVERKREKERDSNIYWAFTLY